MGWFGKLTFGSLGMLLGGPLGAIAGAALGHALVDKKTEFSGQANRSPGKLTGQYRNRNSVMLKRPRQPFSSVCFQSWASFPK
jgi:hypothetical protein